MKKHKSIRPSICLTVALFLVAGAELGHTQVSPPSPPIAPAAAPPKPNSPLDLEKKGAGVLEKIQDLQNKVAEAKKSLEIANRPDSEREKDLDNSILIITTILAEVSEGGEVHKNLQQAITKSEDKLKDYKIKLSDPEATVQQQEAYLNLVNKFKATTDGLILSRMAVTRERENLTLALKEAKRNKILFSDMVQADEMAAANGAVIQMVKSMVQVSNALIGIGADLGKVNPKALP